MKKVLGILLLIFLILGTTACKEKKRSGDVFYSVSFVTTALPYEVTPPAVATVKGGMQVSQPTLDAEPNAGYVVIWTTDPTEKQAYDFSAAVTENLILYAREVPRTYSVRYLLEKGTNNSKNPTSFTKETETITLQRPTMPFGYKFLRWAYYNDLESNVTTIEKGTEWDVVLRAIIEPAEYTIHYRGGADWNPNPDTYIFGTMLSLEAPSKEGYRFLGYTLLDDPSKKAVTEITAEFLLNNWEIIAHGASGNGLDIFLNANWELEE